MVNDCYFLSWQQSAKWRKEKEREREDTFFLSFSDSQLAFILLLLLLLCRSFRRTASESTVTVTNMQHIYENNSLSHHGQGTFDCLEVSPSTYSLTDSEHYIQPSIHSRYQYQHSLSPQQSPTSDADDVSTPSIHHQVGSRALDHLRTTIFSARITRSIAKSSRKRNKQRRNEKIRTNRRSKRRATNELLWSSFAV